MSGSLPEDLELLDRDEAARMLGISPVTLAEWAASRRIGSVKIGRDVKFTHQHIRECIAAHTRPMVATGQSQRSQKAHARKGGGRT